MRSVILCGGSGTRLWPLSRKNFPKQFLNLYSNYSLLQETYLRMRDLLPYEKIYFVSNRDNFFNVLNQIRELEEKFPEDHILIEPKSLNTAPAISLAVKYLTGKEKVPLDEPILILPSDHFIGDKETYLETVRRAAERINGYIGTIGIVPTGPQTGYGYIRKGETKDGLTLSKEFKEKPDQATAEKYVSSGEYVWNAGMYLFQGGTFLEEMKRHSTVIGRLLAEKWETFIERFESLPDVSIDYELAEKSDKVVVFEGDFGWSDIGSFDSLAETLHDEENPRHLSIDSHGVFVHNSETGRLVATVGVDDLVVVESNDSLLIHKRGRGEDVKKVVEQLRADKRKEIEHNILVYRPWGKYQVLLDTPTYKVKKITVYPGAKLSLQSHFHRTEHWIVVRGTATAVNGEREILLNENESTYIPPNTQHRLSNPGKMDLELIEVQTGNYLEEDDIIRFEDIYNR